MKGSMVAKTSSKKNKCRGLILPDFKAQHKSTEIKIAQYCHKDKQFDHQNRIKVQKQIYPHGQLIFNKGTNVILWKQKNLFQNMIVEQLDTHMQKKKKSKTSKYISYLTLYTNITSKWIIDLKAKPKIIKPLEEKKR